MKLQKPSQMPVFAETSYIRAEQADLPCRYSLAMFLLITALPQFAICSADC